ncbi:MAG TPA: glycosyltransferase [Candidatus Limnocylindrales bacterium]|nr:glycosyltransferase [Candidatus Limnocylindrales bacterium]
MPARDLVCFSHLRWDFVFQRPNQLMTRAARDRRVFFVEEPETDEGATSLPPRLELAARGAVTVVTPHVPSGIGRDEREGALRRLVESLHRRQRIVDPVHWFYTPMMAPWTGGIEASTVVYDCMDELSAFRSAPARLAELEAELLADADLVFTGGYSLYEAKRAANRSVFPFPSGVDLAHFGSARRLRSEPPEQAGIARPRLGFFGVIDERIDLALIDGVAAARPDWQLVLIGPVAKISRAALPDRPNIHYLGRRAYEELPLYLAGWDVAIMPFARNAATRFISPTKTPEYLAGGKPVVSTSIRDVVASYGAAGLVRIADEPAAFVTAVEAALAEDARRRWPEIDAYLADRTWDRIWAAMDELVEEASGRAAA